MSVADPGFPRGGANPGRGCQPIILPFFPKLHEIEEILGQMGRPLDPPMHSHMALKFKDSLSKTGISMTATDCSLVPDQGH